MRKWDTGDASSFAGGRRNHLAACTTIKPSIQHVEGAQRRAGDGRKRGHCHSWGTAGTSEVGGGWAGSDGGGETRHWDPATGSRGLSGAWLRHVLDIVNYLRSFFRSSFPYSFILSFSHMYFGSTSCVTSTANKKGPILPLMEPAARVWEWRNK